MNFIEEHLFGDEFLLLFLQGCETFFCFGLKLLVGKAYLGDDFQLLDKLLHTRLENLGVFSLEIFVHETRFV